LKVGAVNECDEDFPFKCDKPIKCNKLSFIVAVSLSLACPEGTKGRRRVRCNKLSLIVNVSQSLSKAD